MVKKYCFYFFITAFFSVAVLFAANKPDERVLATVGTKTITVQEFLMRSELTVRPGNFKNKHITLNNLITEKILALEAESSKPQFLQGYQNTLRGIKEQLMRDKLYEEEVNKKVKVDNKEISRIFPYSTREYEVEFFTIRDKELAAKLEMVVDSVPELSNDLFAQVGEMFGTTPVHKVKYKDPDDDVIHKALFSGPLDTGTVIGPLKLSNGDHIFMRIKNWVNYPLISGVDQREQWNKIQEKLRSIKSAEMSQAYVLKVMKGKKLEFNRESFNTVTKYALEYYLQKKNDDTASFKISEIPTFQPDIDMNAPFFTIDGKVWSIKDFQKEVLAHPLVFRTKYIDAKNFQLQFKLAVVDMVRDYYLTQEAYKKKLDKSQEVKRGTAMWEDAFLATNQLKKGVDSITAARGVNNDATSNINVRTEYLQSLQQKYSTVIKVDYDLFNSLTLTKIDLVAMRPGVPYPIPVPSFPAFIPSSNLDYAKNSGGATSPTDKK